MTPTTYGRDFAYCLKSHGGVRGFNASLWRFLLRCTLFCHSVATFLTSVSSYEGGCGFEVWNFLFYNTDFHENRAHVHVGKRGTEELCKIWLEPEVEMAKQGDLTDKQVKEVLDIAKRYQTKLLYQWKQFKEGKTIRIIKIKK